jgi:hypothetical protein
MVEITSVADPDLGSVAFLTSGSGSGMGKKIRIWIRDEHPGSFLRGLEKQFFGLQYLNSLMRIRKFGIFFYPRSEIRDGKNFPGWETGKICPILAVPLGTAIIDPLGHSVFCSRFCIYHHI